MSADPAVHTCPVCSKDAKKVTFHFKNKGRTGDAFCGNCNTMFRDHIIGYLRRARLLAQGPENSLLASYQVLGVCVCDLRIAC